MGLGPAGVQPQGFFRIGPGFLVAAEFQANVSLGVGQPVVGLRQIQGKAALLGKAAFVLFQERNGPMSLPGSGRSWLMSAWAFCSTASRSA